MSHGKKPDIGESQTIWSPSTKIGKGWQERCNLKGLKDSKVKKENDQIEGSLEERAMV